MSKSKTISMGKMLGGLSPRALADKAESSRRHSAISSLSYRDFFITGNIVSFLSAAVRLIPIGAKPDSSGQAVPFPHPFPSAPIPVTPPRVRAGRIFALFSYFPFSSSNFSTNIEKIQKSAAKLSGMDTTGAILHNGTYYFYDLSYVVTDGAVLDLPSTGRMGSIPFCVAGLAFVAAGLCVARKRNRKNAAG